MPGYFGNKKGSKWYFNGVKIGEAYMEGERVYQSAFAVTYHVDTANVYTEAIVPGTSALDPVTFTPEKSGWTFKGWRQDTVASEEVETELTAKEPISLYAVFEQDITATFKSYSSDQTIDGVRYYNNGNSTKASVTVPTGAEYTDWIWRGWSAADIDAANATVTYANGDTIEGLEADATFYGLYIQTIDCTFKSYNSTKTASGDRYYNASGNSTTASVTVPTGASYSGWAWRGWSDNGVTTANADVEYANGGTISGLTSDKTYYGLYQQTITLSYNGNNATGGSTAAQTGTRYWNAYGSYSNPSFTLRGNGYSKTNCTFQKWAQGSKTGTQYAAGASVTLSASTTFYAIWYRAAVSNYKIASGQGGGDFSYTFNTYGYTSVTAHLHVSSGWAYVWLGSSDRDTASGGDDSDLYMTLTSDAGNQTIPFTIRVDGGYGGTDNNTNWQLTVTAS